MDFADLLADGVMRTMEDCTAEHYHAISFELGGWHCGHFELQLLLFANYEGFERFVIVHEVQIVHTSDELSVQSEEYISSENPVMLPASTLRTMNN